MEGNFWYFGGHSDEHNRYGRHHREADEDMYRGAYRFDNESRDRNETTYDGFSNRDRRYSDDRSYNRQYRSNDNSGYYANDNYSSNRGQNWNKDRMRDSGNWSQNRDNEYQSRQRSLHDNDRERYNRSTSIGGNFDSDYRPDPYYSRGPEENYGNMAGSLSYGYDGDYNADWETRNRHYNPLTGSLRNYQKYYDHHPEQGSAHPGHNFDHERRNDYDRY
ncbi:hypothetical protein [Pontibacter burrus]|uniref:Uncharacterized protein n=1 Tax=Pontibacter burrus TaxID=2704466 RepID=A0A6B3LU95_9BACT|nr:hypothetical protein [Pontibacter burrus]NEM97816.1 hypothetical protein [Pontibacter burrus]